MKIHCNQNQRKNELRKCFKKLIRGKSNTTLNCSGKIFQASESLIRILSDHY